MSIESSTIDATAGATKAGTFWERLGARIERLGEMLNPLLVKEVRQALKSRQFSITFTAVLCLSWLWSIAGVARLGPTVAYGANGPEIFFGYYLILAFPLILIVPYSAYRSLIAEREDNTYELVAITTLRPRQIVAGKLGSAVAQMAVYFSAVAPCLAFTYLLRGIDVPTIFWIMFYTFLASFGFSLCALLLATIAREKHWQVMLAVVIVVVLFYAFLGSMTLCREWMRVARLPVTSAQFWIQNAMFLSFYASTFALLYLAAAAQLTFTAENRSTPLRRAMLVQEILWVGWIAYEIFYGISLNRAARIDIGPTCALGMFIATIYWFVMGAFMTGEAAQHSQRVNRRLPTSTMGRALLTWFNPGPGIGYVFAVSNVVALAILTIFAIWYGEARVGTNVGGMPTAKTQVAGVLLLLGYLITYLGVGNLLLRLLRRFTAVNLATGVLVNVLLLLAGWGIPTIIDPYTLDVTPYNLGHLTDPFWTCVATFDPRTGTNSDTLLFILLPIAVAVFLMNLVYTAAEIRQERVSPPTRVLEEDAALTPTPTAEPPSTNPWN